MAPCSVDNYMETPAEYFHYGQQLNELLAQKKLNIRVHRVVPFTAEGVQQAERDLVGGKTVGKLIVKVTDE